MPIGSHAMFHCIFFMFFLALMVIRGIFPLLDLSDRFVWSCLLG